MCIYINAFLVGFLLSITIYTIIDMSLFQLNLINSVIIGIFNVINIYLQYKYKTENTSFIVGSFLSLLLTVISLTNKKADYNILIKEFIVFSFLFFVFIFYFNRYFNLYKGHAVPSDEIARPKG